METGRFSDKLNNPAPDQTPRGVQSRLPEIDLDARIGRLQVTDVRLFGPSERHRCGQFIQALCMHKGVRRASIDSEGFTCRVDFDLASNSPAVMAGIFRESLETAVIHCGRRWCWPRGQRWSTLVAYRCRGAVSTWEGYTDTHGRIRLIHQHSAACRNVDANIADLIADLDLVEQCVFSRWSGRLTVVLGRDAKTAMQQTLTELELILERRWPLKSRCLECSARQSPVELGPWWKRGVFLAMAGGALTLTLLGLVIPGVPTVPFLLAASYYLARSSPRLNEHLRHTPFFGPILLELDTHAASAPPRGPSSLA